MKKQSTIAKKLQRENVIVMLAVLNTNNLVALAFIPNPEMKKWINHKDGNKTNIEKHMQWWRYQQERREQERQEQDRALKKLEAVK